MLNELDKELEVRELKFVRYTDDCIILVKSEKGEWKLKPHLKFYQKLIRKLKQLTDRS